MNPLATDHRSNNIDALRILLAFLVVFSHCYGVADGSDRREPLFAFSGGQATLGGLAVDWFFILSGYLIAQSWERSRTAGSYLMKRVRRIYPGYVVACAVCVWVVVPLASPRGGSVYSWWVVADNAWRFLTLRGFRAPDAFVTNRYPLVVNNSLWTIPFEFWCYIGIMALGLSGLLRRKGVVAGLLLAGVAADYYIHRGGRVPGFALIKLTVGSPREWARLLPCYLSGTLLYLCRDRIRPAGWGAALALAGLLAAARVPYGLVFAVPTLAAYLLIYAAFTTAVTWHRASAWGDFSYGVYLYSFPIQQLIAAAHRGPLSPGRLFLLSAVPSLAAGVASWYLVERWFLRPGPRRPSLAAAPALSAAAPGN